MNGGPKAILHGFPQLHCCLIVTGHILALRTFDSRLLIKVYLRKDREA